MDIFERALEIANKQTEKVKQTMDDLNMTAEERAEYVHRYREQLLGLQETVAQYKEEA